MLFENVHEAVIFNIVSGISKAYFSDFSHESQVYLKDILGISQPYLAHIFGINKVCLRNISQSYLRYLSGIGKTSKNGLFSDIVHISFNIPPPSRMTYDKND